MNPDRLRMNLTAVAFVRAFNRKMIEEIREGVHAMAH